MIFPILRCPILTCSGFQAKLEGANRELPGGVTRMASEYNNIYKLLAITYFKGI